MSQSLAKILIHLVFSTKKRNTWLDENISSELYPYISKILTNHKCNVLKIGGAENHIHILYAMAKNLSIGKIIEEIKTSSSKWIKEKNPKYSEFYCQPGYGAFSISNTHLELVCNYIANQKQHHQVYSFVDELRALLQKNGLQFDEQYFLD